MRLPLAMPRALAALGALVAPCAAQYLNRAVWLGSELEGVRRDYRQGPEYFLDRQSWIAVMPWERGISLDPFRNRFDVAGGSVSTSRLTIESVGNVRLPLDETFALGLHYLQSEHQTTQFQRFGVGLAATLEEATHAFVMLEGTPDKSRADLSFGVELGDGAHGAHRVSLTAVDFAWGKGHSFEYDRPPFALLCAGFLGDPATLEVAYELGAQLPFRERRLEDGRGFDLWRTIGAVEARLRLGERDRLLLALDCEFAAKEVRPAMAGDPEQEDFDTQLVRLGCEWWQEAGEGREWAIGTSLLQLRNDGARPYDPALEYRERRLEAMASLRARLLLSDRWALEPYLLGGYVDFDQRLGGGATARDDFAGFQGKWGVPARYRFSAKASLRFDVAFQLDEFAFGGGGIQLAAVF